VPSSGFVAQDPEWPKKYRENDWNRLRVVITGKETPHITVWLNGKKTVDYTETKPGRIPARGYLGLQVHGGGGSWGDNCRVRFRKVQVRELEEKTKG
jgi:hypothetical protein